MLDKNLAPEGWLWVCLACGKTSYDLYGRRALNYGWDESCALNAKVFEKSQLIYGDDGLVKEIRGIDPMTSLKSLL